jgi:hypothetical protein
MLISSLLRKLRNLHAKNFLMKKWLKYRVWDIYYCVHKFSHFFANSFQPNAHVTAQKKHKRIFEMCLTISFACISGLRGSFLSKRTKSLYLQRTHTQTKVYCISKCEKYRSSLEAFRFFFSWRGDIEDYPILCAMWFLSQNFRPIFNTAFLPERVGDLNVDGRLRRIAPSMGSQANTPSPPPHPDSSGGSSSSLLLRIHGGGSVIYKGGKMIRYLKWLYHETDLAIDGMYG